MNFLDVFADDSTRFSSLFRRMLSLSLDVSLSSTIRTNLLAFLLGAFQSLDNGLVRKECASLVSISIWHNLASESGREQKFKEQGQNRKAWRAASRRFETADEESQAKMHFERSWLYTLLLDFVGRTYGARAGKSGNERTFSSLKVVQMTYRTARDSSNFLRILKANCRREDMSMPCSKI